MAGPISRIFSGALSSGGNGSNGAGVPVEESASTGDGASSTVSSTVIPPSLESFYQTPGFGRTGDQNSPVDYGAPGYQEQQNIEIERSGILGEVSSTIESLLSGDIPDDVIDQIEQTAAERGISTGILGQAGEFMTARDLGLTSLDLMQSGIEGGLNVANIETQRNTAQAQLTAQIEQSNQAFALSFSELQEQTRQWEDTVLQQSIENEFNLDQLQLQTAQLVSQNQIAMQTLINDIVINNSRKSIEGAQDSINDIASFFETTDSAILQLMGIRIG